jgi:hypothetical protein
MAAPQQQINLTFQQMVGITDMVLKAQKEWFEMKRAEQNSIEKFSIECVKSIHHTRLLLPHFYNAKLREAHTAPSAAPAPSPQGAKSVIVSSAVQTIGS